MGCRLLHVYRKLVQEKKMTAIEQLQVLREARVTAHVEPTHVPDILLFQALDRQGIPAQQTRKELNEAFRQGIIRVHRTINGQSIELIDKKLTKF